MLRPATPLTVLLLISFVLLLLSVISTPVIKGIPLATFDGVSFGVFGYCKGSDCSPIRVGYTTDKLFNGGSSAANFNLPFNERHTLSSILIVHPIAAFMNLACLGLAAAAHFHSPSHSARYLLGLLILLFPTLLVTLLAFLVDILLFVPHLGWGGWIVLASTILITASGVVTCAMRRTLVSRKARKKRIAENAEMSGENFYSRQSQEAKMLPPLPPALNGNSQQKAPMVNGAPGADNLPSFATYEASRRRSDDEKRSGTARMPSTGRSNGAPRTDASDPYGAPPIRSQSQGPLTSARDEFGNPLPPSNAFGPMPPMMGRQPSGERRNQSLPPGPGMYRDNAFAPPRGGGYGPSRGRGGYPPRGSYGPRAGYSGSRGGPPPAGLTGRGGYPSDRRGGYPGHARGGFAMDGVAAAGVGMATGAMMDRGPRPPPPGYPPQDQYSRPSTMTENQRTPIDGMSGSHYARRDEAARYGPPSGSQEYARSPVGIAGAYGAEIQSPVRGQSPYGARNQSPVGGRRQQSPAPPMPALQGGATPVGRPIEMDAAVPHDADVRGMIGLQQDRQALPENTYPQDELNDPYVPPRAAWAGAHHAATLSTDRLQNAPVELPTTRTQVGGGDGTYSSNPHTNRPRVSSGGSDIYYEDVDPRFAAESDPHPHLISNQENVPQVLKPGVPRRGLRQVPGPDGELIPLTSSYENLQEGARSPAESETSNFTSVSQRGVNPNWRPGPGGPGDGAFNTGFGPPRNVQQRQAQRRNDVLLAGNPDFEIPGLGGRGARAGIRGGSVSRRPVGPPAASSVDMGGESRYPLNP